MAKHTLKILRCEHCNIKGKGKGYNTNLGIQKKLCECKNNLLKHAQVSRNHLFKLKVFLKGCTDNGNTD